MLTRGGRGKDSVYSRVVLLLQIPPTKDQVPTFLHINELLSKFIHNKSLRESMVENRKVAV